MKKVSVPLKLLGLVSLRISSEYIGRIYDETKKRPQYIINKKINIE